MSARRFILTRATVDDMPEIIRLEYRSFQPNKTICELFMGCQTEDDIPRITAKHIREMSDPYEVWVKIVDSATGKIVAASNWKFFVNGGAPRSSDEHPPDWLEGEKRREAVEVMSAMNDARRKANPSAHVHGHIAFTDPDYRRHGLCGMIMQWGCDMADLLFLPAWIEPTEDGRGVYKKFGFYEVEPVEGGLPGNYMRRDARTDGITSRGLRSRL
ncbi:hypothetical protein F5X97DRAFT_16798 [Nemania serpens]|nr:hypothetical protein F5X97DRAFT_16798 [Nemania serpens]